MNLLERRAPRLFTYLAICGLAMALGWGIRGQFGHERGAMIPGVLTAMAVALVSTDPNKRNRVAALGVAGGLGLAVGGVMSYGKITGFMEHRETLARGIFLLGAKGAIWGGIGGAVFGMALSRVRYRWLDLLWLLPVFAFWFATGNVPSGESLSDGDMSKTLGVTLLALLVWLRFVKNDRAAVLFGICSLVGFGVGFPSATALCKWGEHTTIVVDWWKVAEMTWGLCGGLGWGLAAYLIDEEGEGPRRIRWGLPTWLGLFYVVGFVPMWNVWNGVEHWIAEKGLNPTAAYLGFAATCGVFMYVFAALVIAKPFRLSAFGVTALAYAWVASSMIVAQLVKMAMPFPWGSGEIWTHITFFICFVITATYGCHRWARTAINESAAEETEFAVRFSAATGK